MLMLHLKEANQLYQQDNFAKAAELYKVLLKKENASMKFIIILEMRILETTNLQRRF